jgi:hypothetical protein
MGSIGYPNGITSTFKGCPLIEKGGDIFFVQEEGEDNGKIFIHNRQHWSNGRYVVSDRDILHTNEMIEHCEGCKRKNLHNPEYAIKSIFIDRASQIMEASGILINGPKVLPG